ncbi:hypothetical protein [Streptomyces sp. V1I1]|uniref:hypothetical protein n=1 Tax=Streptomyces sp. V1I1 TaxID=3042272 RepID=UPI002788D98D|nr:hypothetical protein [Streptomyces sp. V1I1]MDQ0943141.1 hypothetical protein [Streptomyces sp. V1I1]
MAMELPRPKDLAKQNPTTAGPLNRWQRKEIDRASAIMLLQERGRILLTELKVRGYNHLEDVAEGLAFDRIDRLEEEYRKSENPMRRRYIEEAMERWMHQITAILREHNS